MTSPEVVVRRATQQDLPLIGELGAMLVRAHHEIDPSRFLEPGPDSAKHYGSFLGSQLGRRDAAVFVAERAGRAIGYLYLESEGLPRVVLWTAEQNHGAQRFFEQAGFRRTMIEMTRDLPAE